MGIAILFCTVLIESISYHIMQFFKPIFPQCTKVFITCLNQSLASQFIFRMIKSGVKFSKETCTTRMQRKLMNLPGTENKNGIILDLVKSISCLPAPFCKARIKKKSCRCKSCNKSLPSKIPSTSRILNRPETAVSFDVVICLTGILFIWHLKLENYNYIKFFIFYAVFILQ